MLRFEAAPSIVRDTTAIRLAVTGMPDGSPTTTTRPAERGGWPYEAAIVPAGDDPSRSFVAMAEALDEAGETIGTAVVDMGFARGRTLSVTLRFDEECRGVTCSTALTCEAGECVSSQRSASALPDYVPFAGDAGSAATPDAWLEAVDALPHDATVPADAGEAPFVVVPSVLSLASCVAPSGVAGLGSGRFAIVCSGSNRLITIAIDPSFDVSPEGSTALSEQPSFVVVANVHGDDAPEILVTLPTRISAFASTPDLTVVRSLVFPSGVTTQPILAVRGGAPFDDFVASSSRGLHVVRGAASGFAQIDGPLPSNGAVSMAFVASIGAPGLLVLGNDLAPELHLHLGSSEAPGGLGALSTANVYEAAGESRAQHVGVADLNRDGVLDAFVMHGFQREMAGTGRLDLLLGQSGGGSGLTLSARRDTGPVPGLPTVCDLDGDEIDDVVVPHLGAEDSIYVLRAFLSDGEGNVAEEVALAFDEPARAAWCGDLDGDSDRDLLVVHGTSMSEGHVSVVRNDRRG
jgi:hypothetical protein